jgi:hypothetical protein
MLAACGPGNSGSEGETGLIPVGDGVSMKPMGKDETGCPMYQPVSDEKSVIQVIHYPDGKGGFTMSRDAADCPPVN